ncbi:hypothetical protein AK973_2467 [Pseudomonas brassicacearum]|nr:hypothetical protein AK973_2467 [Pseudomonas brassicacearum]
MGMQDWQHYPLTTIAISYRNTHPIPPSKILNYRRCIQGFVGPV